MREGKLYPGKKSRIGSTVKKCRKSDEQIIEEFKKFLHTLKGKRVILLDENHIVISSMTTLEVLGLLEFSKNTVLTGGNSWEV